MAEILSRREETRKRQRWALAFGCEGESKRESEGEDLKRLCGWSR